MRAARATSGFHAGAFWIKPKPKKNPNWLGSAAGFSLFGDSVTAAGASTANLLVGSNGFSVIGSTTIGSRQVLGDAEAAQCNADVLAGFNFLQALPRGGEIYLGAARQPDTVFAGDMAGLTFRPGVFFAGAAITGSATTYLDARGDPNAIWVLAIDAATAFAAAFNIQFVGGVGSPANVYWVLTGAFTAGAGAQLVGTHIGPGAQGMGAGASLNGRFLSNTGALTLSANVVTTVLL